MLKLSRNVSVRIGGRIGGLVRVWHLRGLPEARKTAFSFSVFAVWHAHRPFLRISNAQGHARSPAHENNHMPLKVFLRECWYRMRNVIHDLHAKHHSLAASLRMRSKCNFSNLALRNVASSEKLGVYAEVACIRYTTLSTSRRNLAHIGIKLAGQDIRFSVSSELACPRVHITVEPHKVI